jgi:hypothetical protein
VPYQGIKLLSMFQRNLLHPLSWLKLKLTLKGAADSATLFVVLLLFHTVLYAEHMNNNHCEIVKFLKFDKAFVFLFQVLLFL